MAAVYQAWFGWQDRLIARADKAQRTSLGFPERAEDPRCDAWYGAKAFMVANSACARHAPFLLVVLLLARRPELFVPSVVIGMTAYWALILLARRVAFRRSGVGVIA